MPSRFSPGVIPRGGNDLSAFVAALEEGAGAYQVARERKRGREREDDQDAINGITVGPPPRRGPPIIDQSQAPAAPAMPRGVEGILPDETAMPGVGGEDPFLSEVAQSAMPMPAAPEPRSASGIPGGFDPSMGRFSKPIEPIQLPSGKYYDPQRLMDRRLSESMQLRTAEDEMAESRRGVRVGERASQLGALAGTEGFEELDAGMITAGSDNDALYNAIVLGDRRGRPIDPLSDKGIGQGAKRAAAIHKASGGRSAQEEEAAQEAEGSAWLSQNLNNPAVAQGLKIINGQRPDLARRPGLAAYYVREALRKSGQMENTDARTAATEKRAEKADPLDALRDALGGAAAPGPAPPAAGAPTGKVPPAAPPGVDPAEWQAYLKDTGQVP